MHRHICTHPDVDDEERLQAVRDGGLGVGGLDDAQLAGVVLHEPGPATAELAVGAGRELGLVCVVGYKSVEISVTNRMVRHPFLFFQTIPRTLKAS